MSILIRGMEMPKTCSDCELYQYGFCMVTRNVCDKAWTQRHDDCPLIEIQSPHGRLIDADALNTYNVSPIYEFCVMGITEEDIGLAETIIEAEGRNNEFI